MNRTSEQSPHITRNDDDDDDDDDRSLEKRKFAVHSHQNPYVLN
jgi:hypothetical protein